MLFPDALGINFYCWLWWSTEEFKSYLSCFASTLYTT